MQRRSACVRGVLAGVVVSLVVVAAACRGDSSSSTAPEAAAPPGSSGEPAAPATPPAGSILEPARPAGQEYPPAILRGLATLQTKLGASGGAVVDAVQRTEWPDGCLGLGEPGELCTQATVPGWRATVTIDGHSYDLRTDASGDAARWR